MSLQFLGSTEVDKPKGIDVVKQGIQKLKFNQQLRKSEAGSSAAKTPKVELTISVDGVAIQEPKTKRLLHQYPLHKISYCADDKAEKRFFSFIAKEGDAGSQHTCFVFVSDKLVRTLSYVPCMPLPHTIPFKVTPLPLKSQGFKLPRDINEFCVAAVLRKL